MANKTNLQDKKRPVWKTVLLVIVFIPASIITLLLVYWGIISPIFDVVEKTQMLSLEKNMKQLYRNMQSNSGSGETWRFGEGCASNYEMSLHSYGCSVAIEVSKTVNSLTETKDLSNKYYAVVVSDKNFELTEAKTDDGTRYNDDTIITSDISAKFKNTASGVVCQYDAAATQDNTGQYSRDTVINHFEDVVAKNPSKLKIHFDCYKDKARGSWYHKFISLYDQKFYQ